MQDYRKLKVSVDRRIGQQWANSTDWSLLQVENIPLTFSPSHATVRRT